MTLEGHKISEDIYENNIYTQTPKSKQLTWYRNTHMEHTCGKRGRIESLTGDTQTLRNPTETHGDTMGHIEVTTSTLGYRGLRRHSETHGTHVLKKRETNKLSRWTRTRSSVKTGRGLC